MDNTLAAFEQAITAGVDMIEIDVRRTRDGVLVLSHDAISSWESGGQIPTLEEAVRQLAGRVMLDVELKEPGYEAEVLAVVQEKFAPDSFIVSSYSDDVVARVKVLAPEVCAGLFVGFESWRAFVRNPLKDLKLRARIRLTGADFIVCSSWLTGLGLWRDAARAEMPVVLWKVNSEVHIRRWSSDGRVAGIITDAPELVIKDTSG